MEEAWRPPKEVVAEAVREAVRFGTTGLTGVKEALGASDVVVIEARGVTELVDVLTGIEKSLGASDVVVTEAGGGNEVVILITGIDMEARVEAGATEAGLFEMAGLINDALAEAVPAVDMAVGMVDVVDHLDVVREVLVEAGVSGMTEVRFRGEA